MCILASPALGPGVAVERRRVAAPVAAATARAPGRHGVRAAPGGAAHGAARPGDFVGGAWGGAGARGPASDGGGGGVRGQRARAAVGPPDVPYLLLPGVPRPRAPGSAPVPGPPGRRWRQDPPAAAAPLPWPRPRRRGTRVGPPGRGLLVNAVDAPPVWLGRGGPRGHAGLRSVVGAEGRHVRLWRPPPLDGSPRRPGPRARGPRPAPLPRRQPPVRPSSLPLQRRLRFVRCLRRPFAVGVAPA